MWYICSMQRFIKRYATQICYFLVPMITILLTEHIAGSYFLDYVLLASGHSDTPIELSYLKLYTSGLTNHIFENPHMGAPLISDQNYWPWRNIGIGSYYFIVSLFENDLLEIYRIFYYSLFPLSALSMFISLRHFIKVTNLVSLGISLIYSFMPFMFVHNIHHATVLVGVIFIPLVLGSIFYINFKDFRNFNFINLLKSKQTIFIAIILFLSVTLSLFSAFYTLILLSFLLIKQYIVEQKDLIKIRLILFFIGINLLAILFNIYPHLLFRLDSHFTFNYMTRNFIHTTLYSVSIVDFFVPVKNHVFDSFKFYSQLYSQGTQIRDFFNISYIGLFGISSFLFSIICFFKKFSSDDSPLKRIAFIGGLIIFLILVFVRGGFLTSFYLYFDFLVLGSNYRITPWILCLSLMSGAIILELLYSTAKRNNFLIKEFTKPYLNALSVLLFLVVVSFSLIDMRGTKPHFNKKDIPSEGSIYEEEKLFFEELDKVIDEKDMILQVPYVCFQETKDILGTSYRNLWPYLLINKDVRFAAMAMREGIPCNINSQLSSMSKNVSEMIKHAIYYGYTGLMIEKRGFSDNGESIASDIKKTFNLEPLINMSYLYYDIRNLKTEFSIINILPSHSNPIQSIRSYTNKNLIANEIKKIAQLFPSPCVDEGASQILDNPKASTRSENYIIFNSINCNANSLYNKDFFHFSDDTISTAPGIKMQNGLIILDSKYSGNALSVNIGIPVNPGSYQVFIKSNNGTINNKNLFSILVTKWGKSFLSDGNLVFILTDKVRGTKLSPLTISVRKNISEKDVVIRSITIRKIEVNK